MRIVCPSRSAADQLGRTHPAAAGAVRVVPHGVPERFLTPARAGADELRRRHGVPEGPYFLHVGGARVRKNVPLLLRAFAAYRDAGGRAALVMAGPGRAAALRESVARMGYVHDDLLVALYDGALALVVSSESEGFGIPVLEAMARGTAVVSSPAGGLPEAAGGAAMIVEPPDASAFAEAMARVERDGPLRHDLGRRGRERAASARWEDSAARLVAVLAEAVG